MSPDSRAGQRREQIIQATFAIISEGGLAGVTMKKIAARVGVSEAALYRYFPTKDDLLAALFLNFKGVFSGVIQEIRARTELSARDKLVILMEYLLEASLANKGFAIRMFGEVVAMADPRHLELMQEITAADEIELKALVEEAQPPGSKVEAQAILWIMRGIPASLAIWAPLLGNFEEETARVKAVIPLLIDGLLQ